MRRSRRGGGGLEFGGSGEDSFVAVVVTKLTGALLFILLLAMVIMALLPKAIEPRATPAAGSAEAEPIPLEVATPEALPEAIAGRPYTLALAARGGRGPLSWAVDGKLPEGLAFDPATAQLRGTPKAGTPEPITLVARVADGDDRASKAMTLVVYQADRPLTTPSRWRPNVPPIPWRAWVEQGFGFLVLFLVYLVGMNAVGGLERWSSRRLAVDAGGAIGLEAEARALRGRFFLYRLVVRLATLAATAALAAWLWRPHP
ncbi:MAG TPA: Ig domain-containing protein [Isosphaeraceae bacterium]|jgi:hypothetical protein|nr:Ig domain-containing protein [Isosphaeraceae bacterium]